MSHPKVLAVHKSDTHTLKKFCVDHIFLEEGEGVLGDAHYGNKVKHQSRVAKDPNQPNLRQVHLIHAELHRDLSQKGYTIEPGEMGENITTSGIDLLSLPQNTILHIGSHAQIRITGLRNPCHQLDSISPGLMNAVLDRDSDNNLIRKAGVMSIVLKSGSIHAGDKIRIELPQEEHQKLTPV